MIASTLHQPISEILSWDWPEIVDRYSDAVAIEHARMRFDASLVGAKIKV